MSSKVGHWVGVAGIVTRRLAGEDEQPLAADHER
jgi:hypothetical protein